MTTIKVSTNREGLFTPINPYPVHSGHRLIRKSLYQQWKETFPPALCYNADNHFNQIKSLSK